MIAAGRSAFQTQVTVTSATHVGKYGDFAGEKKKKQAGQVYKRMAGEFPGEHPRAWIGVNGIHEMFFEKRRQ